MLNFDALLEEKIHQIEAGAPLEAVLESLPPEAKELAPLVRLAAAVRTAPHPEPVAETIHAQRQVVMAAAIRNTRPAARQGIRLSRPGAGWAAGAVLGVAALALMCILTTAGLGLWLASSRNIARVERVTGQVQVATNPAAIRWKNISAGYQVKRGERLRTLGASTASLVYFDGSRTLVSPGSELAFSELNRGQNNAIQVKINQLAGETWNQVTPFQGNKQSYFLVQTPSGTASVHGTSFNVIVSQTGLAHFMVNTGEVEVKGKSQEVTLQAGQATSASAAGEIDPPTYQFSITGAILAVDADTGVWEVSGLQFQVVKSTVITAPKELGANVKVNGRILSDNTRIADTIEPAYTDNQTMFFTGPLEKKGDEYWAIGGSQVKVDGNTLLGDHLEIGVPVKVTYNMLSDGTWLALQIESLAEGAGEPTPAPVATADPNALPSYAFIPDELESQGCGSGDFLLTGTLKNTALNQKDIAAGVQLDYLIDSGGEYARSVELVPAGWDRIDAGQSVTFNIHVIMNENWAAQVDESQVKLRIFIASAINRPDHLNGQLSVSIESGCKPTPGAPEGDPTGDPTPEFTEAPPARPTGESPGVKATDGQCTGANPHPTGLKLAQRYGVPYEEIMYWFCQHYGFGEIDLAYSLSRQTGKPVEEIFAMRASGMGWGNIKKELLQDKKNGDSSTKPGKGKDKDKKKP